MQNFVNNNYSPEVSYYGQLPDPSQNTPFNKATHPSDKPIISKHIFAVDSRQRDYNLYPQANNRNAYHQIIIVQQASSIHQLPSSVDNLFDRRLIEEFISTNSHNEYI